MGRDPAGTKKLSQDGVMQGSAGLRVSQGNLGSLLSEAGDLRKRGTPRDMLAMVGMVFQMMGNAAEAGLHYVQCSCIIAWVAQCTDSGHILRQAYFAGVKTVCGAFRSPGLYL